MAEKQKESSVQSNDKKVTPIDEKRALEKGIKYEERFFTIRRGQRAAGAS